MAQDMTKKRRLVWGISAAATAVAIVASGVAVYAVKSAHEARKAQEAVARQSEERAAEAKKIADSKFDISTLPDCPAGDGQEAASWSDYPFACVNRNSAERARNQIAYGAQTTFKTVDLSIPSGSHKLYARLKYADNGEKASERPLLVYSHGLGASYLDCEQITDAAVEHGYAVLSFDFYGGSKTSKSGGSMMEMSIDTEKADLLNVVSFARDSSEVAAVANASKMYLAGASQGGLVSTMAAAQLEEDGTPVKGMVLYYPAFNIPDGARLAAHIGIKKLEKMADEAGYPVGPAYLDAAKSADAYALARRVDCPVMIVQGEADGAVPERFSRAALEAFPNAKLVLLPGEQHGFTADGSSLAGVATLALLRKE